MTSSFRFTCLQPHFTYCASCKCWPVNQSQTWKTTNSNVNNRLITHLQRYMVPASRGTSLLCSEPEPCKAAECQTVDQWRVRLADLSLNFVIQHVKQANCTLRSRIQLIIISFLVFEWPWTLLQIANESTVLFPILGVPLSSLLPLESLWFDVLPASSWWPAANLQPAVTVCGILAASVRFILTAAKGESNSKLISSNFQVLFS